MRSNTPLAQRAGGLLYVDVPLRSCRCPVSKRHYCSGFVYPFESVRKSLERTPSVGVSGRGSSSSNNPAPHLPESQTPKCPTCSLRSSASQLRRENAAGNLPPGSTLLPLITFCVVLFTFSGGPVYFYGWSCLLFPWSCLLLRGPVYFSHHGPVYFFRGPVYFFGWPCLLLPWSCLLFAWSCLLFARSFFGS